MALTRVLVLGVAVVAACACLLCPAAALVEEMMKAPGAGGAFISRAAFEANPKLYFHLLRHSGVDAAVKAFGGQSITATIKQACFPSMNTIGRWTLLLVARAI